MEEAMQRRQQKDGSLSRRSGESRVEIRSILVARMF